MQQVTVTFNIAEHSIASSSLAKFTAILRLPRKVGVYTTTNHAGPVRVDGWDVRASFVGRYGALRAIEVSWGSLVVYADENVLCCAS